MTLLDVLTQAADASPDRRVCVLQGGSVAESTTFEELHAESGRIAAYLNGLGVRRGDRVGIALPNSIGFIQTFFGICAAGAISVPLPPPLRFASLEIHLRRIGHVLTRSRVALVFTDQMMASILRPAFAAVDDSISVVCLDDMDRGDIFFRQADKNSPALIQYTSGTSGAPKGVVLTHSNLVSNINAIRHALDLSPADIGCSWLPLFHDMGLIGHMLVPIAAHAGIYLMPPEEFLRQPFRWLEAISALGVTVSSAPSSAYAHCIRHISEEQTADLDLSQWRLALNGAESIDGRVMLEFAEKFNKSGFQRRAFLPVYGLAEASLAVTFPPVGRDPLGLRARRNALARGIVEVEGSPKEAARELISVGSPIEGMEYRLVAEDGVTEVGERQVGEIQIRGLSVSDRYEDDEDSIPSTPSVLNWRPTGDLGATADGELYIVGRKKEVIVVLGENYYASDVEAVVSAIPGIPSHGVLAMSVPTDFGEGGLLIFIEIDGDATLLESQLAGPIRYAVSSSIGLTPQHIIFVPKGRISRTSSGKFLRHGLESLVEKYCPSLHQHKTCIHLSR